ncbi:MAG: DUF1501 domain-containing protein [Burkholderiaceae bacterium]
MKINKIESLQRRAFMQRVGQLSIAGVATPWALNLAAMGEAAAASADDYKAIVCIFLYGGNDHGNTIIPVDASNYEKYLKIRTGIATPLASLAQTVLAPTTALPGGMQLALAPEMLPLKQIFDQGKLAVQLNIGTLFQPTTVADFTARRNLPSHLFSHNDQQSMWQSSLPEGAVTGWGGRLGDLVLSGNGGSTFTCVSITGNAVFLAGQNAISHQVGINGAVAINGIKNGLFGSKACGDLLNTLVTKTSTHKFENEYAKVVSRSISSERTLTSALSSVGKFVTPYDTSNALANQLNAVARIIAARSSLGLKRQVFMVSMGGFDLHDNLPTQHPELLKKVADAMTSFYNTTVELGISDKVTAFTASDFGRTLASNGDGSDHGWGSHHFVMGGSVKGKQFYGNAPEIALTGPDYVGSGRLLPSTSVDQLTATLGKWFGVPSSDLNLIAPNLRNFSVKNLGFL